MQRTATLLQSKRLRTPASRAGRQRRASTVLQSPVRHATTEGSPRVTEATRLIWGMFMDNAVNQASGGLHVVIRARGHVHLYWLRPEVSSSHTRSFFSAFLSLHAGFLDDIRDHTDRTPTDDEIAVAREYLALLETATREDHVKSTDVCDTCTVMPTHFIPHTHTQAKHPLRLQEIISQVPTEFIARTRALEEAEAFVTAAASGDVAAVDRT